MADAFWVHGNAAQLQLPSDLTVAAPTGPGFTVTAQPNKYGWIHIPLATPTVVNDVRAKLTAIHLDFSTPQGSIEQIEIYDGSTPVLAVPNEPYGSTQLLTYTLPTPHSVERGIGLSIRYGFNFSLKGATPPANDPAVLTIYAAGADYTFG